MYFTRDNYMNPQLLTLRDLGMSLWEADDFSLYVTVGPSKDLTVMRYRFEDSTALIFFPNDTVRGPVSCLEPIIMTWYKRRGSTENCYYLYHPDVPLDMSDIDRLIDVLNDVEG